LRRAFVLLLSALMGCAASFPRPETSTDWDLRRRQCRDGDQRACHWKGIAELREGKIEQAAQTLQRSCEAGVAESCNDVGFFFSQPYAPIVRDAVKGRALWQRACERGSKDGCDSWGTGLRDGVGGPVDLVGAVAAYERACKLEDSAGCTNLAAALLEGRGAPIDAMRAEALWRKICARDDIYLSCRLLGSAIARGRGLPVDVKEGLSLLRRACNNGKAADCLEASSVMQEVGSKGEALRYLRTSCDWGSVRGCRELGRTLRASGDPEDSDEAEEMLQRACDARDEESCQSLKASPPVRSQP
jgi:TPR repeat protein